MLDRFVGIHVSIAGNIQYSVERAIDAGCVGTFQIFTCSPRRWAAKPLEKVMTKAFRERVSESKFQPVVHMPYMPNLSSPDNQFYSESVNVLIREIKRCSELGISLLVLHFGSHMGSSIEEGHNRIVQACRKAISETESQNTRLLLENSAGTRNSVGSRFEFIRNVLDRIGSVDRMGVCLDTCHAFASGYDLRTDEYVRSTIAEFDETIGVQRLFLIHVNDSKGGLAEGNDRHEHIGQGRIGDGGFKALFASNKLRHAPLVLETPIDERRNARQEVAHVKKLLHS